MVLFSCGRVLCLVFLSHGLYATVQRVRPIYVTDSSSALVAPMIHSKLVGQPPQQVQVLSPLAGVTRTPSQLRVTNSRLRSFQRIRTTPERVIIVPITSTTGRLRLTPQRIGDSTEVVVMLPSRESRVQQIQTRVIPTQALWPTSEARTLTIFH